MQVPHSPKSMIEEDWSEEEFSSAFYSKFSLPGFLLRLDQGATTVLLGVG
jgi:hypothetical protein